MAVAHEIGIQMNQLRHFWWFQIEKTNKFCLHGFNKNISSLWEFKSVYKKYRNFSVEWKKNESGFRPPLCTYRLNWARRTSWGWWDDWDDTVLQTQDSKFEPWRSEAEHATSRSRRLSTILTFTRGWGRNIFVSFKPGTEPRTLAWKAAVLTTTPGPPPHFSVECMPMKHKTLNKCWFNVGLAS